MNDGRWVISFMTALFGLLRWALSKRKSEGCLPEVLPNNHCIDGLDSIMCGNLGVKE